MKLNNKGITTVEVLICFILVVIITVSMYATISSFNERKIVEGYKEKVFDYKNLLTKDIQDDFIKIGLVHAKYEKSVVGDETVHTINCDLKDGSSRTLVVKQTLAKSSYHTEGSTTSDDEFMILYGPSDDMIEYPIPDLGSYKNNYGNTVKDLEIDNVLINITEDDVLSIYIGFYHPDLQSKYAINIVCPIDYTSTSPDSSSGWNY